MIFSAKVWFALLFLVTSVLVSEIDFIFSNSNSSNHYASDSVSFDTLYFALTSQKINEDEIEKLISELNTEFEKDFANALLLKRKQKFIEAFKLLEKHLKSVPDNYYYYDELVWLASVNDTLNHFENLFPQNHFSKYHNYLKALLAYQKGNYSESINFLNNANEFNQLYLLSHCYRAIGDYQQSINILDSCQIICPEESHDYVKLIISKGSVLLLSGKYNEAEKIYQKGYELALKSGNKKEETKALINLAILNDYNGKVEEAQKQLQAALKFAFEIEDIELQALIYSETGVSYTYSGNIVEARKQYERSLEIYKKLKNNERLANLCSNIGLLFIQTGNYSAAIKSFEDGLLFAGENVVSKIINLRGLGDVYLNISDYSKALEFYNQAKIISEKIKNVNQRAVSDLSIGTLFYNLNRPNKALSIFKKILTDTIEVKDPYFQEDLFFKIALAYSDLDSTNLAQHYFSKALSITQSIGDVYYETLIPTFQADNFIKAREYNKAENLLNNIRKRTIELGYNQLYALQTLLGGISRFNQKKIAEASALFREAEEKSLASNDFNTAIEAKYYLAQCFEIENRLVEAEKKYSEAITLIEKISSSATDKSQLEIYHFTALSDSYLKLTDLYLRESRFTEAFNLIEKFRARNTVKNLNLLKLQTWVPDYNLVKNYCDINWKLNSEIFSFAEKDSLKKIYDSIKTVIASKYNFNSDSLQFQFDVRYDLNKISKDDAIISYYFNNDECFAFIITHNNFNAIKLNQSKYQILETVRKISPVYDNKSTLSNTYYNQDLFSFNSIASFKLYKAIFEPIKESLTGYKKLIFSLPVELSVVPLEFLISEFDSTDSPFYYDNKKFLIEQFAISYVPSVSVYLIQSQKPLYSTSKLLLVGDPKIDEKDFAQSFRGSLIDDQTFANRNIKLFPLKYSREEIEEIASVFSDVSVLLSDNATEENFLENADDKSIIHLSTHSIIHNNQPFIIFTKDNKNQSDGFLETGEIIKLKLHSELVVLSSCKSGLGSIDPTEGIIGMQKSFFEAGSKSVIVSLWDVNDKFTALFMKSFYKFLSEGLDKAEALRQAKLFFKKNYSSNPYYWAAFILSGDNSRLNISKSYPFELKYVGVIILFILLMLIGQKIYLSNLEKINSSKAQTY
jgi:CHAT domain-containing protein/uncharacterized protein HemY